jgi:hypothetical protein
MNSPTLLERFMTPNTVRQYYDRTIFLSPLFLFLTACYFVTVRFAFHQLHGWKAWPVPVLIASVWVHHFVQHRWLQTGDSQTLRVNASRTTLVFSSLYLVTVGTLLSLIH